MKKIKYGYIVLLILIGLLGISSCSNKENNKGNIEPTLEETMTCYIDSLINETTSYIPAWNKESFKGRWNYIDGVFLNSIVTLYYNLKDTNLVKANSYKNFFLNYINYYIDSNGYFLDLSGNSIGFKSGELDTICESKILFDAYEMTKDRRYLNAISYTYQELMNQPRINGGTNFSHKIDYLNQIWLDGMYMYAPFYARYGVATNNLNILNEIRNQYEYIRNTMFYEEKKLYYHGYDSTKSIFWADTQTGLSKSFWLRSMGWYLVSLCDILEYYPEGENKTYLTSLLQEGIDGILQYQDAESKMFYQVIDRGPITVSVPAIYLKSLKNTKYLVGSNYVDFYITNYLESSGSSMIAYVLLKSSNRKYIDEKYRKIGIEVFDGIYNHSFKNNQLNDICITAGLGPENKTYRDGTIEYYLAEPVGSNDAKGVGPFIMAYLEYAYKDLTINIPTPNF